jgi:hypothetical protein
MNANRAAGLNPLLVVFGNVLDKRPDAVKRFDATPVAGSY